MATVVGYKRKTGDYEGHPYSGYGLWLSDPIKKNGDGIEVQYVFVKEEVFNNSGIIVGDEIDYYLDRYKKICKIEKIPA